MVPHTPPRHISTRPSYSVPPASLTAPLGHGELGSEIREEREEEDEEGERRERVETVLYRVGHPLSLIAEVSKSYS